MNPNFYRFLWTWRWISAIVALAYHVRFLLFVNYNEADAKPFVTQFFYFITGLGHESFAIFLVIDGVLAAHLLSRGGAAPRLAPYLSRLMRMYAILVPGILLGGALDLIGLNLFNGGGHYTDFPAYSLVTLTLPAFLGNLAMLQPFLVPTFGSNGMLYLFSYLWWWFLIAALFVAAAGLRKPLAPLAKGALALAVALVMPADFLIWGAIWLLGFVVVRFGASIPRRLPVLIGAAIFFGAVALSRFIGSNDDIFPQPFGSAAVLFKYFFVGAGFAIFTLAMSARVHAGPRLALTEDHFDHRDGATCVFFFHFPIVMFIAGASSDIFEQPLMQQPDTNRFLLFAIQILICVAATLLATRSFISCSWTSLNTTLRLRHLKRRQRDGEKR